MAAPRDFPAAMDAVLSLAHTGAALVRAARQRSVVVSAMRHYTGLLGVDLPALAPRVLHVAGTKGKGSTCVFAESMLRASGLRTGLFTSPHLVTIRERIRLDGVPIEEGVYLTYFWHVWDVLQAGPPATDAAGNAHTPGFFHFMTLLALYVFQQEGVDAVVLEVGMGGRLDSTNVFDAPAVTAVTTLDFDHVHVLGNTLPEIAKEKAGIFKRGVPAFSVPQAGGALAVLQSQAEAVGALPLQVVSCSLAARTHDGKEPVLGLDGTFQLANAALAVALVDTFLAARAGAPLPAVDAATPLPDAYLAGLRTAVFPGRAHVVTGTAPLRVPPSSPAAPPSEADEKAAPTVAPAGADPACMATSAALPSNVTLCLDGAHTEKSMRVCVSWFRATWQAAARRHSDAAVVPLLLFNCGHEKDALELLVPLSTLQLHRVLVCPFDTSRPSRFDPPSVAVAVERYFASKALRDGADVTVPSLVPVPGAPPCLPAAADDTTTTSSSAGTPVAKGGTGGSTSAVPTATPAPSPAPKPASSSALSSSSSPPPATSPAAPLSWQANLARLFAVVHDGDRFTAVRAADAATTDPAAGTPPRRAPPTTVLPCIDDALGEVRAVAHANPHAQHVVLVTGSLYLVGNVLAKL